MVRIKSITQVLILLCIATALILAGCSTPSTTLTPLDPQQSTGKRVYQANCAACHANSGETVIVGPSLAGIASRAGDRIDGYSTIDYIRESIMKPDAYLVEGFQNLMPTEFGLTLTGEEFDALLAYLLTLE